MSGLPAERVKFGFLKDYAIRGTRLAVACQHKVSKNTVRVKLHLLFPYGGADALIGYLMLPSSSLERTP